jgi:hypothetical protein
MVATGWSAMLRIIAMQARHFLMPSPKQTPTYEVWHLQTVIIPRRSITGRLLWGTVLRRRKDGRWIYKQRVESIGTTEYRQSARILIMKSRRPVR